MPSFVKSPNLPAGQVIAAAVGEDYAEEIGCALSPLGIKVFSCPNNPLVDERLRSHIDLSIFHIGGNRFLLAKPLFQSSFADELRRNGAEIIFSEAELLPRYPNDAALCALAAEKLLFHNSKCGDKYIQSCGLFKNIHINQGYAKCAVCLVSESAAITADPGLAKAMKSEGVQVLQISPRGIALKGFSEGFIGGASFKIARDKIAFTGSLDNHPDKREIENFLWQNNVSPIYLTDKPIFDIGSAIPVFEI
ncbi:MAG: hypothetical protein GXY01_04445 [Clostridiales bacterium]|jgi:hypothetical protein|nr:hypothetical protein [Clostridiales bacterium]